MFEIASCHWYLLDTAADSVRDAKHMSEANEPSPFCAGRESPPGTNVTRWPPEAPRAGELNRLARPPERKWRRAAQKLRSSEYSSSVMVSGEASMTMHEFCDFI